jgi:hypothetical protein
MANITNNFINSVLSPAGLTTIDTSVTTIDTTIGPVSHTLTDEERASYFSLDVNNKVFVQEALQEANLNGSILPSAINVGFLFNDITLFDQMDEIESALEGLLRKVRDSKRVAGHEAYVMALTIYTMFKSLAAVGVPGAQQSADRLGERFAQSGGGTPSTEI